MSQRRRAAANGRLRPGRSGLRAAARELLADCRGLADLVGLPVDLVTRAEGRIGIRTFSRELLRDERKIVGLYDATITATDPS